MNAKWLLLQYMVNMKAGLLDLRRDPVLVRNRKFQNIHRGKRCFILGSGHSIKEQDLTKLSNEIVMTQNHFHAHEQIGIIKPAYHVVVPKYQPTEYDNDWAAWLRSMDERLPKETLCFFGINTKYLVDKLSLFRDRAYYINARYSSVPLKRAPVDISRTVMNVYTVLTECLAIAVYMGFQEIYLVGFDLDQLCRMNDRSNIRFYGSSPITANKAEVDAEQALGASGLDFLYHWFIWQQCNLLKSRAESMGLRIFNATRGGLLNMFERRVYEDVVQ